MPLPQKKLSKNDSPPSPFNSPDLQDEQDLHDEVLLKAGPKKLVALAEALMKGEKKRKALEDSRADTL